MAEKKRSSFSGKIGFVLAAAGSAVGLGNIWRFPYLAYENGGGIFLLVYLILAVTFGFALMCAEIAIGRKTGKSAIEAFGDLSKKYTFIGVLASIVPILILPYYSVIGGWVTKYFYTYVTGAGADASASNYFGNFIGSTSESLGWFLIFIGLTALVVLLGVEKGIEKVSKFMMPVLVVLTIGIAVYVLCLPGSTEGLVYYLKPDFSKFSANTVLSAMGQLFYSMSLAMGIMITYGSYMKKDVHIKSAARQIEFFDTGIAFLAGLMIIPAVFTINVDADTPIQGPGLMFQTLPNVFNSISGITGQILGGAFFLLVLFAALTSSISLMETVVSIFRDKFGWSRTLTCLIVTIGCIILGVPSALGNGVWSDISITINDTKLAILDMFDIFSNNILMPIVALLTCIFIGYVIKPKTIDDEINLNSKKKVSENKNQNKFIAVVSKVIAAIRDNMFSVMIKYIAPICIVLILAFSLSNAFGYKLF